MENESLEQKIQDFNGNGLEEQSSQNFNKKLQLKDHFKYIGKASFLSLAGGAVYTIFSFPCWGIFAVGAYAASNGVNLAEKMAGYFVSGFSFLGAASITSGLEDQIGFFNEVGKLCDNWKSRVPYDKQ